MDPVVHFEMPAGDRNRMVNFYSRVFGWEAQFYGEDMGNYVTVTSVKTDDKGRPETPGAINGGFYPVTPDMPPQHPSIVIAVEDIHASVRKIVEAGGKMLGEPAPIPGVGLYASFTDTEGNRISILQPSM